MSAEHGAGSCHGFYMAHRDQNRLLVNDPLPAPPYEWGQCGGRLWRPPQLTWGGRLENDHSLIIANY